MNSRGRRYEGGKPKLNLKKVFAVIIAFAVIIMAIIEISKLFSGKLGNENKTVATEYFPVYTNGKWGVINSKGETIIKPEYEEAIVIPDSTKDVFLCTYNVDYTENTYQTKVINSKENEIITGYETVQALENYDNNNNLWYETDVLLVKKDGKYGLVDFKGKQLLPCEYDSIETLKGVTKSYITKNNNKLGLVDNIGVIILENEYQKIEPVSDKYENGYIVTDNNKKMGVILRDKTQAVEVKYQDIKKIYGDSKYVVKEDGKWEIIDTEGKVYLKDKFDEVISINGENIIIKKDKKYGVITLEGKSKIKTEYNEIKYAFGENYIFEKDKKYGVINLSEETVLKPEYESLIYREEAGFFEGVKPNKAETEFIANDFTVKLTGILSEINTADGYMRVRTDGEYQYYNFKFEPKSNKELLTANTLFLDKKDGKYGYVNKDGIVVVDYIYDDAKEQNKFGYASVKKNGMWGCIDAKGKEVITPAYTLTNNTIIEFINKWHRGEDLNLNYYTD